MPSVLPSTEKHLLPINREMTIKRKGIPIAVLTGFVRWEARATEPAGTILLRQTACRSGKAETFTL